MEDLKETQIIFFSKTVWYYANRTTDIFLVMLGLTTLIHSSLLSPRRKAQIAPIDFQTLSCQLENGNFI